MKNRITIFTFIGSCVLLVLAAFGSLSPATAMGAKPTTPFKVRCQTFPTVVGGGDGYIILEIPGNCLGTHLGRSEWYADSIVDFTTVPASQTGEMTFTAANGAQLFGNFAGQAEPNDRGGFDYWGDFWISGGTGRFSGATGSGTYYGGADGETGSLYFEGTLTRP